MLVRLLPSRRELVVDGVSRVQDLLRKLNLLPGTAMVIREGELLCDQDALAADDVIEIRNVISGG